MLAPGTSIAAGRCLRTRAPRSAELSASVREGPALLPPQQRGLRLLRRGRKGETSVGRAEEYLERAKHAEDAAARACEPLLRQQFLELAAQWRELAKWARGARGAT